jgi:hypothetical protein
VTPASGGQLRAKRGAFRYPAKRPATLRPYRKGRPAQYSARSASGECERRELPTKHLSKHSLR